ncbi:MAG: glycerol-3-phosphate acyltransferase [Anaerolineales bacterium]
MDIHLFVLSGVVGYLLGSISFTRIITRLLGSELDLEDVRLPAPGGGEGERLLTVGATTASMKLGPRVGCTIGLLDILKAFLPTLAFKLWFPDQYYFLTVSIFTVVGHNWPVYHHFRGGGGMSPSLGGFLAVDWIGTLVANVAGMLFGFAVIKDIFFAYVGWTWFMIPWLWIRTQNPVFAIYALLLNLIFFLALLPEIRRYLELRRRGGSDLQQGMEVTPMGRGMLKMARKLGFFREGKEKT